MSEAIELLTRRASFAPSTLDREAGTVQVVLTTGAHVARHGYVEALAIGKDSVTLAKNVPVLDSHKQGSINDILGHVVSVRHEAGRIVATLKITSDAALNLIESGALTGVSIGYRVLEWQDGKDPATGKPRRTATRYEILEVSLVPVPADPGATVRSAPMTNTTTTTTTAPPPDTATRAAVNREIRDLARNARLPAEFADGMIDRNATIDQTRAAAIEELVKRSNGAAQIQTQRVEVGFSHDDPTVQVERMAEALACRAMGGKPSEAARPFMNHRLEGLARICLEMRGQRVRSLSCEEVFARAMHTTSDFPELLNGTGNRVAMSAYEAAPNPLKSLARQSNVNDFRAKTMLRIGEMGGLEKVGEHGEVKSVTRAENKESYSLDTYAAMFSLSRKAMINDDLGAFTDFAQVAGRAAAEKEASLLLTLLTQSSGAGPVMGDGVRLFHSSHGNLAGSGAVISVTTLSAARLAMRDQKGLDGRTPINATPKFLVVPSSKETTAEQVLAGLYAGTVADVNPFSGRLTLLVEPRLTGNGWYVFADPASLPVLEYAYLSSAQGPQMSAREGWDTLGMEFRVILDFGCGAIDHRGAYRNPGA